jgi:hypothetical protein
MISCLAKEENMNEENKNQNMKGLLFAISLMVAGITDGFAQIVPETTIENTVRAGTVYQKLNDQFVLTSPATGNLFNAGYIFLKISSAKKTSVLIDGSFGSLSNRDVTVKMQTVSLYFSQGFSLIKSADGRLNSYWGYSLGTNPLFIKVMNKDEVAHSWSTSNDLSLYQSFVYKAGRNRITWDVNLPLIGLASRPAGRTFVNTAINGLVYDSYSNLFVTSWQNRKAVSSSLDINRMISKQISFVFGGRVAYDKMEKNNLYKSVQVGVYAGISLSVK